jgi:hypothetical protein
MKSTLYHKFADKHSGKFDADRLRMWAHLTNMGKHSSFETPPDYPFFQISDKHAPVSTPKSTDCGSTSCSTSSTAVSTVQSVHFSKMLQPQVTVYNTNERVVFSIGNIKRGAWGTKEQILEDLTFCGTVSLTLNNITFNNHNVHFSDYNQFQILC